jgi:hypothetical protein
VLRGHENNFPEQINSCKMSERDRLNFFRFKEGEADREEAKREIRRKIAEAPAEFKRCLQLLAETVKRHQPWSIVSTLYFYNGFTLEKDSSASSGEEHWDLQQAFLEFIQGVSLRVDSNEFEREPVLPSDMQLFIQTLKSLFEALQLKNSEPLTNEELTLEEQMLAHNTMYQQQKTQFQRNWGFPFQTRRLTRAFFVEFDSEFEAEFGIEIEQVCSLLFCMPELIAEQVQEFNSKRVRILNKKTTKEIMAQYHLEFTDLVRDPEFFEKFLDDRGINEMEKRLRVTRQMVQAHSDLRIGDLFEITVEKVMKACGLQPQYHSAVERLFRLISISAGDISDVPTEHIFGANPIWIKPLIRDQDKLQLPIPGLIYSFSLDILEELIRSRPQLSKKFEKRKIKSKALENETLILFKKHFPEASFFSNTVVKRDGKVIGENDLLMVYSSHAVIVEVKSGNLSASARRGSHLRMVSDFEKLLTDANDQANRFCNYLRNGLDEGVVLADTSGRPISIDLSGVMIWQKLIVTAESLGFLSANLQSLTNSGLLKTKGELSPAASLADLEIVFDILSCPSEKLHYLMKRAEVQEHYESMADELDLLAVYLDTGLNIEATGGRQFAFVVNNPSEQLHQYYAHDEFIGEDGERPKTNLSDWWRAIISKIENRKPHGWSVMAAYLLNVDTHGQKKLQLEWGNQEKEVLAAPKNGYMCGRYSFQFAGVRYVIALFTYKGLSNEERRTYLADEVFPIAVKEDSVNRMIAICHDCDNLIYPYSAITYLQERHK